MPDRSVPADARPWGTPEQAAALGSAVRLRIIRLCFVDALTNRQLADRLGRDPATTLHHVRRLVDAGFLAPQPVRRGSRGAREQPYRSTGLSWRLRWPEPDIPDVQAALLEAFLSEVAEVGVESLTQIRLVLQLEPDVLDELRTRLHDLLLEYADRPVRPDGERCAVYLTLYPGDTPSAVK